MMIRELHPSEQEVLKEFLYHAIYIPEGIAAPDRSIIEQPDLAVYINDFGKQKGDTAVVSFEDGKIIGCAWARNMNDYGHLEEGMPSIAISVLPAYRNQGVGSALLTELFERLQEQRYQAVSLSVQRANPAMHLYERLGFETVEDHGEETIMKKTF